MDKHSEIWHSMARNSKVKAIYGLVWPAMDGLDITWMRMTQYGIECSDRAYYIPLGRNA